MTGRNTIIIIPSEAVYMNTTQHVHTFLGIKVITVLDNVPGTFIILSLC